MRMLASGGWLDLVGVEGEPRMAEEPCVDGDLDPHMREGAADLDGEEGSNRGLHRGSNEGRIGE